MDITGFSMPDVNAIGNMYFAVINLFPSMKPSFESIRYKNAF